MNLTETEFVLLDREYKDMEQKYMDWKTAWILHNSGKKRLQPAEMNGITDAYQKALAKFRRHVRDIDIV